MTSKSWRCWSALALVALAYPPAYGEKLSKAEISKRGKAATALVEVKPAGTGTAFCVHSSGLFITNEHVVRAAASGGEISLVLDASLKSERVFKARVVRTDKTLDLALLRTEGAAELPSLPLGSVDEVTELMDLYIFGFPLGSALSPDKKERPAITVTANRVTALRRKDGELHRIEMDGTLNPGHSGSPALDDNGRVMGVVQGGIVAATTISRAIPVSHLERFLAAPDFDFTPPSLTKATLNAAAEFKVRVTSVLPGAKLSRVELLLRAGEEAERKVPMELKDGAYRASVVPVPAGKPRPVELTARFANGSLTGSAEDRNFQVGPKTIRLSAVSRIQFQPKVQVVLTDGTVLEGPIAGLDPVFTRVGEQSFALNLSGAALVQIVPPFDIAELTATVVAYQNDKEVGRHRAAIPVRGVAHVQPADPGSVVITPPALGDEKTIKLLPAPATEIVVGGGGRYLILHLPRLKKLAVFDVTEARIARYIPLAEDRVFYGAGLRHVVVGLPEKALLERWNLDTGEKEQTAAPVLKDAIGQVILGAASNGPVLVNGQFFDLFTFRPLPIKAPKGAPTSPRTPVSADGTVFTSWNMHYSPGTSTAFVLEGNELKRYDEGAFGHVVPGPDGRFVYTAKGVYTVQLNDISPRHRELGYCLPSVAGNYFLSLTPADVPGKGGGLTVYLVGNDRPVAKLDKLEHGLRFDNWDRGEFGVERRLFFVPQAKLIVVLPVSMDQLILHRFDPDAALESSGVDYLLVTSQPPASAKRGRTFTYQVGIKSKKGGVTYRLDAAPLGMEVSPTGMIKWEIPAEGKDTETDVILTVRDASGQEVFHTFTLKVARE